MSAPAVPARAWPAAAVRRDTAATAGTPPGGPPGHPPRRRALRAHLGSLAGSAVLAVLLWRTGPGVLLDGLRRIDGPALLAALGIGLVTTVSSAWRWALVARALRLRLPLGPAVADYYRALFLNAALPGGVLGDVHRAVRHGRGAGDLGRGVRAVVLERAAGQLVLAGAGVAVLLTVPSPVRAGTRSVAPLAGTAVLGAFAVVLALRAHRAPARPDPGPKRRPGARWTTLAEAREGLLSRRTLPGVVVSSVVVLAGHLAMFVLAARVAGSGASVAVLTPLAVLALLAMGLPLNIGGWGPPGGRHRLGVRRGRAGGGHRARRGRGLRGAQPRGEPARRRGARRPPARGTAGRRLRAAPRARRALPGLTVRHCARPRRQQRETHPEGIREAGQQFPPLFRRTQ
ncbi:lysylphosphatidylglycerol synthase transmembrane domain-containing protein [Streptomyces sp. MH13]|uniref:lysylphosphatidylglycerol synthase transmembrane domain-containing protein n=1 Tax=Streptomyces sp. MH13 TaxID=3417651 RepID=UPI003CF74243